MSASDVTSILEELAAGRIDAAEASRRIAAVKAAQPADDQATGDHEPTEIAPTQPERTEPERSGEDGAGEGAAGQERPRNRYARNSYARETFERLDADATDADTTDADGDDAVDAGDGGAGQRAAGRSAGGATGDTGTRRDWSEAARRFGPEVRRGWDHARQTIRRDLFGREDRATTDAAGHRGAQSDPQRSTTPRTGPRVAIRTVGHRVRVIGDDTVQTVAVDGSHVLRRSAEVIEVATEEVGRPFEKFSLLRPPRSLDEVRELGLGKELLVRVNPSLVVDAEVTAGALRSSNVPHLGRVRVTAGGARLDDVEQIDDALFQTGASSVSGTIGRGRSRVRCESGSLTVRLGAGSNVTVHADSTMGRVVWAGGHSGAGGEVIMGNGSARLDVGAVMGRAVVHVGVPPEPEPATDPTDA